MTTKCTETVKTVHWRQSRVAKFREKI